MRLLDRLDALDRRLGLGPRTPKRPPNRGMRWIAAHPWWFAVVWLGAVTVPDLMAWLSTPETGPEVFVFNLVQVPVGYVLAISLRNSVQRWDAAHPLQTPPPRREDQIPA